MPLSRRIARPLLASAFIAGGLDAIRNPDAKIQSAPPQTNRPLAGSRRFIPNEPELLVRVNGAAQIGAGVLLATGRFRRLASLALIASIAPTTYAGHRFWDETGEGGRARQRAQLFKNLGLLGGLVLASVDTEGEPSRGWRPKRRSERVSVAIAAGRATAAAIASEALTDGAREGSRTARRARRKSTEQVRRGQAGPGATLPVIASAAHEIRPVLTHIRSRGRHPLTG